MVRVKHELQMGQLSTEELRLAGQLSDCLFMLYLDFSMRALSWASLSLLTT